MQKYENLVDLEKMLQNEYLVAIVAVDTAENELSKFEGDFIHFSYIHVCNLVEKVDRAQK